MKHPGTPNLYDTSKPVAEGGLNFRVNWGLTVKGQANDKWTKNDPVADSLLAVDSYPVGHRDQGRPPARDHGHAAEDGLGQGPHARGAGRPSRRSAATSPRTCCGPSTCPAASSAWPSSTASRRSVTARRAASSGTSRTACRYTASRSTPTGATCCPSTRPTPIASSTGCRCSSNRSRSAGRLQGVSDHPHLGPSRRVRRRRRGEALQPVARRAAAEHVRRDQPADANNLGIKDGQQVWVEGPEKGKVRVMAMVTERVGKGVAFMPFHFGGHFQGKDLRSQVSGGHRPDRARQVGQHGHHLWLRHRHPDAGNQDHALQDLEGLDHGTHEVSLRRGAVHRVQRLRHRLQERA